MALHCTVLIPAYNTEQYVQRCLESVAAQQYPDFDILFVNDGSNDGTVKAVERLMRRDGRIDMISLPENRGVAYATDRGLEMARGPIITIVDSDDIVLPHALKVVMPFFKADPDLGFAWAAFVTHGGRHGWSGPLPPKLTLYQAMTTGGWWRAAHHRFVRKVNYMQSARLNPAIKASSDYQLALVMAATGCHTIHVPSVTYRYTTGRPGSITSQGQGKQRAAAAEAREYVARWLANRS